jgi:two-component system chemotaxis response regulator CheY
MYLEQFRYGGDIMSKTIMTVDDSASVRMMVKFSLQEAGYNVIEAVDGIDALEKLDNESVNMVIADVNMPGIDGIELVRRMRDDPKHRFTPVVMLTTESNENLKDTGRKVGATGWIVKPFKPADLVAVVKKVLG